MAKWGVNYKLEIGLKTKSNEILFFHQIFCQSKFAFMWQKWQENIFVVIAVKHNNLKQNSSLCRKIVHSIF